MALIERFRGAAAAALVIAGVPATVGGTALITASQAEAAVLRNVVVRGNARIDPATIRNYVTVPVGREFGAADLDNTLEALFATGLFRDVRVTAEGATMVITVVENPVVSRVIFAGNEKIRDDALRDIVETAQRGVLSESRLQADAQRIRDHYQRQNRASALVQPQVVPLGDNRVDVIFNITEGGRTGIASIEFAGNSAFSTSRLRRVIQTRATNLLSWLTRNDAYDPGKLEADQEALRQFYLRNGYADFRVLGTDVRFDEPSGRYYITFTVDEGPRYRFGAINVDSTIPGIDQERLARRIRTTSGETFNSLDLERTLEDMTIELAAAGYPFAVVRPRGDRDYQNNLVNITYLIDEGPRAYIERIEIRGNERTRDYVIRREFDISEGDAYNQVLLARVERRLRALGIFERVSINAAPGSAPDQVIVIAEVVEESTGEFAVTGGYSTDRGFIAEISLTERNFLGRGQYLRIAVGGSKNDRNYDISFTEPYFLGRRMPIGFDAYLRTTNPFRGRPFSNRSIGGQVRLGLPVTEELTAQVNYKINQDTVTNSTFQQIFPNGTFLTSSVGYSLTYSTIDNLQDPRDGLFLRVVQDFAGLGGTQRYVRSVGDARFYREILPETEITGLLRVTGGNITGIGQNVRILDNFFQGGETVRGFATMGYGPRTVAPFTPGDIGTPLGGKNFWAATAEVQFPLPLVPQDFGLRGALFADAGALWGVDVPPGVNAVTDSFNTIRSSVGASILWASPFGLLRADFAHVLTKQAYDSTQVFRFSAGTQF